MAEPERIDPREHLGDVAHVYVTLAAARAYAEARSLGEEEARRELTELLLDAHRVGEPGDSPEQWRYRKRSAGVDLTARIVHEGELAVVVAVSARRPTRGPGGGRRRG